MEKVDEMADDTVYFSMNEVSKMNQNKSKNMTHFTGAENDDDVIDYFLENNSDWVICKYFQLGTCKYGDGCKYMHPKSMENM